MASKSSRRPIVAAVLVLGLSGVLAWRVHAQSAYKHAPSGGSATVEGVETVVSPKVPGRLVELSAQAGDKVKRGQVVGRLDCADQDATLVAAVARVKSAEAQVAVAEAALASASRTVSVANAQVAAARAQERVVAVERDVSSRDKERAAKLHESGALASAELDHLSSRLEGTERQAAVVAANVQTASNSSAAALTNVGTGRAQVEAARSAVEAARADQKRAEISVSECTLVAPRDGVVTDRLVEPGAVLAPGVRVLNLVDLAVAKATFFLPNAELGRATIGAPAEVRVDAFPTRVFPGKVRRIASEAEFTPRNVQTREDRDRLVYAVEIEVPNADGALRAGMPAEVTLPGTGR